ncbi:MAG TPA: hypothetical protein VKU41_32745 [Polyangiaceae bacterium]|nr:hypothetical protein [Polyangiaceae bacterium]
MPVSTQVDVPVAHDVAPTWQPFAGVQAAPAVHGLQTPPLQTWSFPQEVPSATFAPVSAHVAVPGEQDVVPAWQGLEGVHEAPCEHAPQRPWSQTEPFPHAVPSATDFPVSTHCGVPEAHDVTPTSQAFAGVHAASAVHPGVELPPLLPAPPPPPPPPLPLPDPQAQKTMVDSNASREKARPPT